MSRSFKELKVKGQDGRWMREDDVVVEDEDDGDGAHIWIYSESSRLRIELPTTWERGNDAARRVVVQREGPWEIGREGRSKGCEHKGEENDYDDAEYPCPSHRHHTSQ